MMRLLIWLVIGLAVVTWIRRALAPGKPAERGGGAHPESVGAAETMVQCAQCGVHFPASEAIHGTGGAIYCSAEHRALTQR